MSQDPHDKPGNSVANSCPSPWQIDRRDDRIVILDAHSREIILIPYSRWQIGSKAMRENEAMALARWIVRVPPIVRAMRGMVRAMRDVV